MSKIVRLEGFVLDYREFGEFDHLLIIFSKEFGKHEVLVKGTKKIYSKLRFCLQRFIFIEYEVVKGKTFDRLIFFKTKGYQQDQDVQYNLAVYSLYSFIAEILLKQLQLEQAEPEIYDELIELCYLKRTVKIEEMPLFFDFFVFRLFWILGLGLNLRQCVISGVKRGRKFYLDFRRGGLVEETYVDDMNDNIEMVKNMIETLRYMQKGDWQKSLELFHKLSDKQQRKIVGMGVIYLNYYGMNVKSFRFFQKIVYNQKG